MSVPKKELEHGTYVGYTHHKCRCDACREANREYMRTYLGKLYEKGYAAGYIDGVTDLLLAQMGLSAESLPDFLAGLDEMRSEISPEPGRRVRAHGTRSGYMGGCRCEPCKDANAAYYRARRRAKRSEVTS